MIYSPRAKGPRGKIAYTPIPSCITDLYLGAWQRLYPDTKLARMRCIRCCLREGCISDKLTDGDRMEMIHQ